MELEDYRTWRLVPDDRTECLLDFRTEQPTAKTLSSPDSPLACIAAVIHANGARLAPEDSELVVSWVKQWKRERAAGPKPPVRDSSQFEARLREMRDSPAQKELMRKASVHSLAVDGWTVLAFVIAAGAVVCALAPGLKWYWSVAAFVAALAVYWQGQLRGVEMAKAWKEQDQRYIMESIRAARTLRELSHAGLFAYLADAEIGPKYDEKVATAALRRERDRLTDALYHNPDFWLE